MGNDKNLNLENERNQRIQKALERLSRFDESWANLFNNYVLQGMYEREVIDQKTRELCAIAALAALDRKPPLMDHIKGAIRQGATIKEITEVIVQVSVYGGFPVALAGLRALEDTLEELGMSLD
jgi:4-carboxymuconolactone decarboxylase